MSIYKSDFDHYEHEDYATFYANRIDYVLPLKFEILYLAKI